MNFLRKLFDRAAARKLKTERAHEAGRAYAISQLKGVADDDVVDVVRSLLSAAGGKFNEAPWEYAFDRGVRDICHNALQDLGAP